MYQAIRSGLCAGFPQDVLGLLDAILNDLFRMTEPGKYMEVIAQNAGIEAGLAISKFGRVDATAWKSRPGADKVFQSQR